MTGLTNKYLEDISKKYVGKSFIGVYPVDVIPKCKKKSFAVIFNLSKHYEPGSHFIAIVKKQKHIIYFDSFGKKCSNKNLLTFMKKFNTRIYYNKHKIQHDESYFCGYYCFYFICYCLCLNKTLTQFTAQFNTDQLKQNDSLLISYIVDTIRNMKIK